MGPIDYTSQLRRPNISENIMQGFQAGEMITAKRKQQEQADQFRLDASNVYQNPSHENIAQLMVKYPTMGKEIKSAHEILTAPERKREIQGTQKVYSALSNNRPDIALQVVNDAITAHENSGEDATNLKSIKSLIESDVNSATSFIGMSLASMMGEKDFSKTFKAFGEERRAEESAPVKLKKENAEIAKLGEELNLKKAQTTKAIVEGKNLGIEGKKAILELEAYKNSGGQDPSKLFEQEEKLRKEYTSRTKNYTSAKDAFNKLSASADDETGAGDTALVFSFMKMLDPGSVVRESEFALAQDTAGLYARLVNASEKVKSGQFLTKSQRADFKRLAGLYMKSAEKQEKTVRNSLGKVIKNYSLNPENVFLSEEAEVVETPQKETQEGTTVESITIGTIVSQGGKRYRKTESGFMEVQ